MQRSAVLILLLISFLSCKKKGTVSGKVTCTGDGSPAENVTVRIVQFKSGRIGSTNVQIVASAKTGADGEFTLPGEYKRNDKYTYGIELSSGEYQSNLDTSSALLKAYYTLPALYSALDDEQGRQPLEKKKSDQYFEFRVVPLSRLKIIARDVPPPDSGSVFMTIEAEDKDLRYSQIFSGNVGAKGMEVQYFFVPPVNGLVTLSWQTTRKGLTIKHVTAVALEPFKKAICYLDY